MKEAISTLKSLGLTLVQAKTLYSLSKNDSLSIKEISKDSGVQRTDLYRVLKKLEDDGLVEKILDNPIKYKAAPINETIDTLIQKQEKQTIVLKKKANQLKKELSFKREVKSKESKFILIPSKRTVDRIGEAIDSAKKNVKLVVSLSRFCRGVNSFSEKLERSWTKNVEWHIIIAVPPQSPDYCKDVEFCRKNSFCEIRFIPTPINTVIGIYDQEQAFIIEIPTAGLTDSPALWTNNSSLISLLKDYFEILWLTAKKEAKYFLD